MKFDLDIKTSDIFSDIKIFQPKPFCDFRGDIWTLWEKENVLPEGLEFTLCKIAKSKENVLRGMHDDNTTWKLVTAIKGEVYIIVANNNRNSGHYKKWISFKLFII